MRRRANGPDEELRRLEAQYAATGDPQVRLRLIKLRRRLGIPQSLWGGARKLRRRARRMSAVTLERIAGELAQRWDVYRSTFEYPAFIELRRTDGLAATISEGEDDELVITVWRSGLAYDDGEEPESVVTLRGWAPRTVSDAVNAIDENLPAHACEACGREGDGLHQATQLPGVTQANGVYRSRMVCDDCAGLNDEVVYADDETGQHDVDWCQCPDCREARRRRR